MKSIVKKILKEAGVLTHISSMEELMDVLGIVPAEGLQIKPDENGLRMGFTGNHNCLGIYPTENPEEFLVREFVTSLPISNRAGYHSVVLTIPQVKTVLKHFYNKETRLDELTPFFWN